jgi:hypothetical protein
MSYYECDSGEHLAPLPNIRSIARDSSTSDGSEVEVTSSIDSDAHELVRLSTYLHLHSDDDSTDDEREAISQPCQVPNSLVSYSISDDSADEFDLNQTHVPTSTCAPSPVPQSISTTSPIRSKRRQWSIHEKLLALDTLDKNNNKYRTCMIHGCSPSQLRKWQSIQNELKTVAKQKKGTFTFPHRVRWIMREKDISRSLDERLIQMEIVS